jgi:uncharacterized protein (DUF486 family)
MASGDGIRHAGVFDPAYVAPDLVGKEPIKPSTNPVAVQRNLRATAAAIRGTAGLELAIGVLFSAPIVWSPTMSSTTLAKLTPILLLLGSNVFMTIAWYGHLRFKQVPLMGVILASWGIAFVEYCLAVPANRYGSEVYSAAELKTIQEVITLVVFAGFAVLYLREPLGWNHAIGFSLIAAGAFFIFQKW